MLLVRSIHTAAHIVLKHTLHKQSEMFSRAFTSRPIRKASQHFLPTQRKFNVATKISHPQKTSRVPRWFVWTLGGVLGVTGVTLTLFWYTIDKVLSLIPYLSQEELTYIRKIAHTAFLNDYSIPVPVKAYLYVQGFNGIYPLLHNREYNSTLEVKYLNQVTAEEIRKDFFTAFVARDHSKLKKFALSMFYSDEDIEFIRKSPDLQKMVIPGKLSTLPSLDEIQRLRQLQLEVVEQTSVN